MENQVSFSYQCITVRQRTAPYPFVHSSPLILCTFFALFHYCTLFMLHLFSCCFMLHSFHVALFSYCTLFKFLFLGVVHFSCFTFSMLHLFLLHFFSIPEAFSANIMALWEKIWDVSRTLIFLLRQHEFEELIMPAEV